MVKTRFSSGEELLLAISPVFKRRYAHDGDFLLGCKLGCRFCYYQWISASREYIGTGKLKRLCRAEDMIEFLKNSRLFLPEDMLILGARGDASMYPDEILEFLELLEDCRELKRSTVLALHRAPVSTKMIECFSFDRFRLGTTITPRGAELGWTLVRDEKQVQKLEEAVETGCDVDRISIEIGPLNSLNIEKGYGLIEKLQDIGFRNLVVRGVAFGTFGVDREKELEKLIEIGFVSRENLENVRENHEYYVLKNYLSDEFYREIQERFPELRIHRYTYTLYKDAWNVKIAGNRNNSVRVPGKMSHSEEKVRKTVEKYGLEVGSIEKREDHYFVELKNCTATEDIAMAAGAELEEALVFSSYRRTASLEDVAFYARHSLFAIQRYLKGVCALPCTS
jgi:hypothetical protein